MRPSGKFLMPILLLLVILPMISTDIYLPAIPSIEQRLEINGTNVLDTLTSYMLGYSFSLIISGVLSDIYGRRRVVLVGIALFFIASVGCFMASSIEQLVVWRFFQALGGGCGTLVARVIVRDTYAADTQVRVLSYLASGLVVSPILGPIIGAYLSIYFGWRSIFLALVISSLSTWVLILFNLRESLTLSRPIKTFQFSKVLSQSLILWGHREFVFNTLIISFAWAIYFTFITSSPALIQGIHKASAVEYGYIFSATISGFVFGTIFIRWMISTFNLKRLVILAGFIILISTSALSVMSVIGVESLLLKLVSVFSSLFGIGVVFPATQAGVARSYNDNIGLISGIFYSTEMLFGAIFGFVLSRIGSPSWESTSLTMLIASICIVALCFFDSRSDVKTLQIWSKISFK
jgi:DHA1 family bicyclomycin/chloramphenicol resistance-like MFS transporter